jgi:hypothetical protein
VGAAGVGVVPGAAVICAATGLPAAKAAATLMKSDALHRAVFNGIILASSFAGTHTAFAFADRACRPCLSGGAAVTRDRDCPGSL